MARPVRVVVLGSGSWGTTVAGLSARNTPTLLWSRNPDTARHIARCEARRILSSSISSTLA